MANMFLLKYRIPSSEEDAITENLAGESSVQFSLEAADGATFINIYSRSRKPSDLIDENYLESITPIDLEALNNKWAENYFGTVLTDNFFVKSPEMADSAEGYRIITLDPVGSFGDGCHATTKLCALMLEDVISSFPESSKRNLSMLDIGTGSGILSIEAALLGVGDIEFFDFYSVSVLKALKNMELNGFFDRKPFQGDIYTYNFTRKYDIITANLLTSVIEDNLEKMSSGLADDGRLIVSGIGIKWTDEIINLINKNSLKIIQHKVLEGWNGFLLSW
jgi:ribosomal protein L11 methyltransferase